MVNSIGASTSGSLGAFANEKGVEALGQAFTQGGRALYFGGTKILTARRRKAHLYVSTVGKENTPFETDDLTMTSNLKSSAPAQLDPMPLDDDESSTLWDLNAIHLANSTHNADSITFQAHCYWFTASLPKISARWKARARVASQIEGRDKGTIAFGRKIARDSPRQI